MEHDLAHDHVLQMVEVLIEFKLDVQTVLDPHFHFHCCDGLRLLRIVVVVHNREVHFLRNHRLHVPIDEGSDEVSDSACNPIEGFVFLLEIGELEGELFVFCKEPSRLEFLRE